MKKLILLVAAISIFSSCYYRTVRGNGHMTSETRNIDHFSGVKLLGSMNIVLSRSDKNSVEVEAEENIIPYVETYVEGNMLVVKFKEYVNVHSNRDIVVKVGAANISNIDLYGSGDITSDNKVAADEKMKIDLVGSGNMKLQINAPGVEAKITGSGNMDLSGETRDLKLETLGSGDINAFDLKSENAEASTMGSGDIHVFASVHLDAHISGSGDIGYKGGASVSQKVNGSGDVQKEGE